MSVTAISGGRRLPRAAQSRSTAIGCSVLTATTWPTAWTPESVRLAPSTAGRSRRIVARVSTSVPWTVRTPGCCCQPWYRVPS